MPVKRYDAETKKSIIDAALDARKADKSWAEAFDAAKSKGYTGSRQGLEQMIRAASRKGAPNASSAFKRRAGRPARLPAGAASGLQSLEALVDQIVKEKVAAALDDAIASLQKSRNSL
ncbi:MAG TPA: hypothetical protein VGP72_06395 [Planctomycetota bacterium]|jgi:hypothetical protein